MALTRWRSRDSLSIKSIRRLTNQRTFFANLPKRMKNKVTEKAVNQVIIMIKLTK